MRMLLTFLLTTSGLVGSTAQAAETENSKPAPLEQVQCTAVSGTESALEQNKCKQLKKYLKQMRDEQRKLEEAASTAYGTCVEKAARVQPDRYKRGDPASQFYAVLESRAGDKPGSAAHCNDRVTPANLPKAVEAKVNDQPDGKEAPLPAPLSADAEFRLALKAYQDAASARDKYTATLKEAEQAFNNWLKEQTVPAFAPGEYQLANANTTADHSSGTECTFAKAQGDSAIFIHPDNCIDEIFDLANAGPGTDPDKRPQRPSRWNLKQTLTTAKSGANAAFTGKRTIEFKGTDFEQVLEQGRKSWAPRRTRTISISAGLEAKLEDGIANIVGANSDDANFLSLDRLNNDVVVRGSFGFNFYRKQKWEEFERARSAFLAEAQAKCAADAAKLQPKLVTDCHDKGLLKWLYRWEDGKYVQAGLVSKFEQLIAKSSDGVPQFGGGFTASAGLVNQNYHLFSDSARDLDPSLVDDVFFSKPSASTQFREINQRLGYTAGIYAYNNWKLQKFPLFTGATLRADLLTKRELENLQGKKTEICRADLGSISTDGIFDAADQCRSTLIFRPKMQTSYIPKVELRLQTKEGNVLPALGIAPSYQREFRNGRQDKTRWEIPLFLTSSDGKLNGGLGVAFTDDGELSANQQATTFFIFLGRKFSLDGSE